jgi:hypothetical protein
MLQVEHDAKWIKRLSALSKVYFTPTFIGVEQLDASQPAMYVGNHSMYGVLDSPMLIDYLYNEHQVAVVSIADHSHFYLPTTNFRISSFMLALAWCNQKRFTSVGAMLFFSSCAVIILATSGQTSLNTLRPS